MTTQLAINEVEYINGKDEGKMISAFFPCDCNKNCTFCTTKHLYKDVNVNKFRETLINVIDSDIEEIVFTGGEPLSNLNLLEEFLVLSKNKKVYINTCFNQNIEEAVILINSHKNILGVNISRHDYSDNLYKEYIKQINCNVRINVVNYDPENIPLYISQWNNLKEDLNITFREDYRNVNIENMYNFNTPTLNYLTLNYKFYSQVYCHVCNKYMFKTDDGFLIRYHRGLNNTRIKIGVLTEIQEFVLFPNGNLYTDWDGTNNGLIEISSKINLNIQNQLN
jgi:organic radical activating enzyme